MKERITRTGQGAVVEGDRTDWDRLRAMTDEQVEATIADDPDWTPFEDVAMRGPWWTTAWASGIGC